MSQAGDPRPDPGLYLHVPFCSAICPYCDFSVLTGGSARREAFVRHLQAEIGLWSAASRERFGPFGTVYLGGGTPSLLSPGQLGEVFEAVRDRLGVTAGCRWFLEANPEDVTAEALSAWRALGVETLSLGVQSFDDEALRFLGRRHTGEQARRAVRRALGAGFSTVSADLIYGLPGFDAAHWRRDLETAVALGPDHLSCYQLTIHEGTPFGFRQARGGLDELPEDDQAERFLTTHRFLADHGYEGYEVSNFATAPEHRSRHNAKYWDHTPYLGLGPSAHSHEGTERWWNHRKVGPWQQAVTKDELPVEEAETLTPEDRAFERLMLALRTKDGLDLETYRERYGVDLAAEKGAALERLMEDGLVRRDGERIHPTLEGLAVADHLVRALGTD